MNQFSDLPQEKSGSILVVDDDRSSRQLLQALLSSEYDVELAESGNDALQMLGELTPDLIVLDVEMPGLNGYETCRKIRETSDVPVIFVTGHTELEAQLEAFDAGANDIVHKPVSQDVFQRKVARAIQTHASYLRLQQEKSSIETMAMGFLSSVGETGVLMNFLRDSIQCRSHIELANRIKEAAAALEMQCYGVIRSMNGEHFFRSGGEPTGLEREVLAKVAGMGRIFQFKNRMVVNYEHISLIATNVPSDDSDKAGKVRDNLCILAETAESLTENVEMRLESSARAEQLQVALVKAVTAVEGLQGKHRSMLADTRILLQELVDTLEKSFAWLGTTTEQEYALGNTMNESVQKILDLISTRGQFENEFAAVVDALRGPETQGEVDLF